MENISEQCRAPVKKGKESVTRAAAAVQLYVLRNTSTLYILRTSFVSKADFEGIFNITSKTKVDTAFLQYPTTY